LSHKDEKLLYGKGCNEKSWINKLKVKTLFISVEHYKLPLVLAFDVGTGKHLLEKPKIQQKKSVEHYLYRNYRKCPNAKYSVFFEIRVS